MSLQYSDNEYIKLYRRLISWEWYTDINTKVLFIHCLLRANWKPGSWKGIHYERGQFITSLKTLSAESGLSMRQTRTALNHLIETGELTSERQTHGNVQGRIITVINYDLYQSSDKPLTNETSEERQSSDNQTTSDRQATDNRIRNIKNIKEDKEVKKDIYTSDIAEVLDYLNSRTGKKFTGKSKAHRQHIVARLKEGFTVEDFKKVIDNKVAAWGHSEKMAPYLRPETLFSSKFETYLNDVETERQKQKREEREIHEQQLKAIRMASDFDVGFLQ